MMNEMADSDPRFNKVYESFILMLQRYQLGDKSEEGDARSKSLNTSLCGKEGRIRSGILGKRVNNIGRAVAACDTTNAPDEATLPIEFV
jgi:DNA-directed RNA polymerase beta' subunit